MRQQTVGEIENRQPPRRISVAEGIALAKIFGLASVEELGSPPRDLLHNELAQLEAEIGNVRAAAERLVSQERNLARQWERLRRAEAAGDRFVTDGPISPAAAQLILLTLSEIEALLAAAHAQAGEILAEAKAATLNADQGEAG